MGEQQAGATYLKSPNRFSAEDYRQLLTAWPYQQSSKRKKIAVLGAGISGLLTAWLLQRAGHDVRIFEASNVVGGRIKTLRDRFTGNCYAEAGAMRIPRTHKLTLSLVKFFQLKTLQFINTCNNQLYYIDNVHITERNLTRAGDCFNLGLNAYEIGKSPVDLFKHAVESYIKKVFDTEKTLSGHFSIESFLIDYNHEVESAETDRAREAARTNRDRIEQIYDALDKISLRQFLQLCTVEANCPEPLSAGGVNLIATGLAFEMSLSTSMVSVLRMFMNIYNVDRYYQIYGGLDHLPRAFVDVSQPPLVGSDFPVREGEYYEIAREKVDLSKIIRYNSRVVEIEIVNNMPSIKYENTITKENRNKRFDLVICSIPFSALRHVRMRVDLVEAQKRRALRLLHYDNSCKILMEFSEDFWSRAGIKGGKTITDLPIRQTYYPNPQQNSNALLLASYTWGDDSLRWTSLKPDDRIRFALRDFERVHRPILRKQGIKRLGKLFISGMSHSWAEQEFTGGAFAMFEPYQSFQLFDDIWKPSGRIHYCGEHTSTKQAWIEGAVESALRVSREVCERIEAYPELDPKPTSP